MNEPQVQSSSAVDKFRHVMLVALVFAALGPPVGWGTLLMISLTTNPVPFGEVLARFFGLLIPGGILSYFFGLPLALFAGLVVGLGQILLRSFGLLHAFVVGLAVGLLLFFQPSLFTWFPDLLRTGLAKSTPVSMSFTQGVNSTVEFINAGAMIVSICVVPTLVCWFIAPDGKRKIGQTVSP